MVKVYFAPNTRSLRVLWTLEELGVPYEAVRVQFPARQRQPEYLDINPAGSIPAMVDGAVTLTESLAICEYLSAKHGGDLAVGSDEAGRAEYMQWLLFGEASLTPPLGTLARLARAPQGVAELDAFGQQARETFALRLTALERRLEGRDFVTEGRLTVADVSNAYALHLASLFELDRGFGPNVGAYWARQQARPAFQRAKAVA
jgi:glutathione S-transferase